MLTPGEIEEITIHFQKIMEDLEVNVMTDVCKRIKKNDKVTSTADYLLSRRRDLMDFRHDLKGYISDALELTDKEINKVFEASMQESYIRDKSLYEATGTKMIPYKENQELQQLVSSVKQQTFDSMKNITRTMAMKTTENGQMVNKAVTEYFQNQLDYAVTSVLAGTSTMDNSIKEIVHNMAQRGIRTVDWDSGVERSIEAAARSAIMTGVHQVSDKIDDINMEKLDTKYVEVSWHIGARNKGIGPMNHQSWQGRCYYYDKSNPMADSYVDGKLYQSLVKITGYGTIEGLCGVNCRHSKHAFIPGVSSPVYSEKQLADMNDKENQTKLWKGKEYDTYKAMEHMRSMERLMRGLRRELKLLKAVGLDDDPDYINMKARYRGTSQQYSKFAKAMGLQEQRQRVYDDGIRGKDL